MSFYYSGGNVRWPRRVLHLVSHVEYAPRALLTLEKRWDRQTDGRQTEALRLPLDAASLIIILYFMPKMTRAIQFDATRLACAKKLMGVASLT